MSKEPPRYLSLTLKQWQKKLKARDPLDRRLAAYAIGRMGKDAQEAVDDLKKLLEDKEMWVRVWAASALAHVVKDSPEAIEQLMEGLQGEPGFVRSLAAWHLSRIHCEKEGSIQKALPQLEALMADKDRSVQVEAELAWKRIHSRQHLTHGS